MIVLIKKYFRLHNTDTVIAKPIVVNTEKLDFLYFKLLVIEFSRRVLLPREKKISTIIVTWSYSNRKSFFKAVHFGTTINTRTRTTDKEKGTIRKKESEYIYTVVVVDEKFIFDPCSSSFLRVWTTAYTFKYGNTINAHYLVNGGV